MEQQTTEFIPTAEVIQEYYKEPNIQETLEKYLDKLLLDKKLAEEAFDKRVTAFTNEINALLRQAVTSGKINAFFRTTGVQLRWDVRFKEVAVKHKFDGNYGILTGHIYKWFICNAPTIRGYKLQSTNICDYSQQVYAEYEKM
jgi:hypothetical protein